MNFTKVVQRARTPTHRSREYTRTRAQVKKIIAEPLIRKKVVAGELMVVGAFYEITSGLVGTCRERGNSRPGCHVELDRHSTTFGDALTSLLPSLPGYATWWLHITDFYEVQAPEPVSPVVVSRTKTIKSSFDSTQSNGSSNNRLNHKTILNTV